MMEATPKSSKNRLSALRPFPLVLYEVLAQAEHDLSYRSVLSWEPNGQSFVIYDRRRFSNELMPLHFSYQTHFASFQRQLNLYGFRRVSPRGLDAVAYKHPCFLKGHTDLCSTIQRSYNSRKIPLKSVTKAAAAVSLSAAAAAEENVKNKTALTTRTITTEAYTNTTEIATEKRSVHRLDQEEASHVHSSILHRTQIETRPKDLSETWVFMTPPSGGKNEPDDHEPLSLLTHGATNMFGQRSPYHEGRSAIAANNYLSTKNISSIGSLQGTNCSSGPTRIEQSPSHGSNLAEEENRQNDQYLFMSMEQRSSIKRHPKVIPQLTQNIQEPNMKTVGSRSEVLISSRIPHNIVVRPMDTAGPASAAACILNYDLEKNWSLPFSNEGNDNSNHGCVREGSSRILSLHEPSSSGCNKVRHIWEQEPWYPLETVAVTSQTHQHIVSPSSSETNLFPGERDLHHKTNYPSTSHTNTVDKVVHNRNFSEWFPQTEQRAEHSVSVASQQKMAISYNCSSFRRSSVEKQSLPCWWFTSLSSSQNDCIVGRTNNLRGGCEVESVSSRIELDDLSRIVHQRNNKIYWDQSAQNTQLVADDVHIWSQHLNKLDEADLFKPLCEEGVSTNENGDAGRRSTCCFFDDYN